MGCHGMPWRIQPTEATGSQALAAWRSPPHARLGGSGHCRVKALLPLMKSDWNQGWICLAYLLSISILILSHWMAYEWLNIHVLSSVSAIDHFLGCEWQPWSFGNISTAQVDLGFGQALPCGRGRKAQRHQLLNLSVSGTWNLRWKLWGKLWSFRETDSRKVATIEELSGNWRFKKVSSSYWLKKDELFK